MAGGDGAATSGPPPAISATTVCPSSLFPCTIRMVARVTSGGVENGVRESKIWHGEGLVWRTSKMACVMETLLDRVFSPPYAKHGMDVWMEALLGLL